MYLRTILPLLIVFFFSCTPSQDDVETPTGKSSLPKIQSPIHFTKDQEGQDDTYYIALETSEFLSQEYIKEALQPILSNYQTVRGNLQVTSIRILTLDEAQPMIFVKYFRKFKEAKEALSEIQLLDSLKDYTIASYIMSQDNFRLVHGNRSGLAQYHEFMASQ